MTSPTTKPVLPTDSEERKELPLFSGVLNYFPLALAAVSRVSKRGNDKHNPGEPLHWSRGKSTDHEDCIARHLLDVETIDAVTGEYEDAQALAWRALAKLQELEERRLNKPMSRGSRPTITVMASAWPVRTIDYGAVPPKGWKPFRFTHSEEVCSDPNCDHPQHFGDSEPTSGAV